MLNVQVIMSDGYKMQSSKQVLMLLSVYGNKFLLIIVLALYNSSSKKRHGGLLRTREVE